MNSVGFKHERMIWTAQQKEMAKNVRAEYSVELLGCASALNMRYLLFTSGEIDENWFESIEHIAKEVAGLAEVYGFALSSEAAYQILDFIETLRVQNSFGNEVHFPELFAYVLRLKIAIETEVPILLNRRPPTQFVLDDLRYHERRRQNKARA